MEARKNVLPSHLEKEINESENRTQLPLSVNVWMKSYLWPAICSIRTWIVTLNNIVIWNTVIFYKSNKIMMKHFPKKRGFLAPKIIDRCKPRETYQKSNNLPQCNIFLLSKVGFWSGRVKKKIPDMEDGPQFLSCQKSCLEPFDGLNN